MRPIVSALTLLILFIGIPSTAAAVTAAEIQAQIQVLLAEVQQLQRELANQGSVSVSPNPTTVMGSGSACPLIGRVLKKGSTGDDVSRLQAFLAGNPSIYPEGQITGYYGALTEAAVMRWQAQNNIVSSGDPDSTGFGVVGPRTAAAISVQCGNGSPTVFIPRTQEPTGPTVGGFIQVTPVSGRAPLTVQVIATVNTVNSCEAATYMLDWGDGTIAQNIPVPAGNCGPLQQTYSHIYIGAGVYTVRLAAGQHSTTATVQVTP